MVFCGIASGKQRKLHFAEPQTRDLNYCQASAENRWNRVNSIGRTGKRIKQHSVNHEHSDHIKELGVLARKHHVQIHTSRNYPEVKDNLGKIDGFIRDSEQAFSVEISDHQAFDISHDAARTSGLPDHRWEKRPWEWLQIQVFTVYCEHLKDWMQCFWKQTTMSICFR